jgi:hypothetical protein
MKAWWSKLSCTPYSTHKTRFVETACRVATVSKVRAITTTILSDCCGGGFAMHLGNDIYVFRVNWDWRWEARADEIDVKSIEWYTIGVGAYFLNGHCFKHFFITRSGREASGKYIASPRSQCNTWGVSSYFLKHLVSSHCLYHSPPFHLFFQVFAVVASDNTSGTAMAYTSQAAYVGVLGSRWKTCVHGY